MPSMDNQQMQEQMAFMQAELSQLSDEVFAQQKEIADLRLQLQKLNAKLNNVQADSGILNASEDSPPPHY